MNDTVKRKVGDAVTVISLDELRRRGVPSAGGYRFDGQLFNQNMNNYCGQSFKIIKVSGPSRRLMYNLDLPSPNPSWYFSEGMIRPAEADPVCSCFVDHCEFNEELL